MEFKLNNSLYCANELMRNKKYFEALRIFEKISANYSSDILGLSFNINFCKAKINQEFDTPKPNINSIKDILYNNLDKKCVPLDDVAFLNVTFGIINQKFDANFLLNLLRCLEASPFQRSILRHVYNYISLMKCEYLLNDANKNPRLNLASLILLANDENYWYTWRLIILSNVEKENSYIFWKSDLLTVSPLGEKINSSINLSLKDSSKNLTFGTILLNEQKFIGLNLLQHYDLCDEWILVEGACRGYPERKVTKNGLSKDFTASIIECFPDPFAKINYIKYGWTNKDGENAKSELRNQYANKVCGDYLVVIDADEFYQLEDLDVALNALRNNINYDAVVLPQVHFWKTTNHFITGEYYDISHTRIFRSYRGMEYKRNHNFPEINGRFIHEGRQLKIQREIFEIEKNQFSYKGAKCYHMGFAKDASDMEDKTQYYINRGENVTRVSTTKSRAAWFTGELPDKCKVRNWAGSLPKVLTLMRD